MKPLFAFIVLSSLIIGCNSPNREIIDSFEKVNKSLEHSNDVSNQSIDGIYQSIKSKTERNSKYLSRADTIYRVGRNAINFLEIQRHNLISLDSSGESLDVASAALIESRVGDTVRIILEEVYKYSCEMLIDKSKKKSIDSVMSWTTKLKSNKNWKHEYFYRTPTIAAMTILAKFQIDCETTAGITLIDIYEHMK